MEHLFFPEVKVLEGSSSLIKELKDKKTKYVLPNVNIHQLNGIFIITEKSIDTFAFCH